MENPQSRTIADVFNILDCWRHLPKYRLEPQLAPFFALFLPDILSAKFKVQIHPIVIPEFPLRIRTLKENASCASKSCKLKSSNAGDNQSYNVDYVAFSRDQSASFLVELKSDLGSVVPGQKCYLKQAVATGIGPLIDGIDKIQEASDKKGKYKHLRHRILELDLKGRKSKDSVVYIQPERDDKNYEECFEYIYFNDVANVVQGCSELGAIFANYLRQWTAPAGERNPEDIAHYR